MKKIKMSVRDWNFQPGMQNFFFFFVFIIFAHSLGGDQEFTMEICLLLLQFSAVSVEIEPQKWLQK